MASPVDICNLALGRLGDRGTVSSIDPPEGSAQAEHCQRFYPIARDSLLEWSQVGWRFATTRATLAAHALDPVGGWTYAYTRPADCLKPLHLLSPIDLDDAMSRPHAFSVEVDQLTGDEVIYTHLAQAVLVYTQRVEDSTRFTPLFVDTLSVWLASYLAGPLIKGVQGVKTSDAMMQKAVVMAGKAAASDANSTGVNAYRDHVPDHIRARGGSGGYDVHGRSR